MKTTDAEIIRAYVVRTGVKEPGRICDNVKRPLGRRPSVVEVRAALDGIELPDPPPVLRSLKTGVQAISLQNLRIADKRPNEGLKARIYALRKGQGYPVTALAEEWVTSEDTVRAQAKRLDCLRFVELSPGEWVQCVLNPDTATEISKR
jgi:hypothetical protein